LLLGGEVLRAPQLARLPSGLAVDVVLALVLAFTKGRAAALWVRDADGKLTALASAGDTATMPVDVRELASRTIAGDHVAARPDGDLAVTDVVWAQGVAGVLVVFGDDVLAPDRRLLLRTAEPLLTLALERRHHRHGCTSDGSASTGSYGDHAQRDALTAVERRLNRLRFDLHDGPQQDIIMLAEDLQLFRTQLESALAPEHEHLLGRMDDLEARLIAVDGDLRRISVSVQSPFLHQKSFEEALDGLVKGFTARCGLEPTVDLTGDFTTLTDSQHITLLGLIREALNNIREHSHADHVAVSVAEVAGTVNARITDDGRGFDPETTLVDAARGGHLGLVGMHERVRMLGGTTDIDSRPGGPTVITAALPAAPTHVPRRSE
jgi:signal transduction histidine kinase